MNFVPPVGYLHYFRSLVTIVKPLVLLGSSIEKKIINVWFFKYTIFLKMITPEPFSFHPKLEGQTIFQAELCSELYFNGL